MTSPFFCFPIFLFSYFPIFLYEPFVSPFAGAPATHEDDAADILVEGEAYPHADKAVAERDADDVTKSNLLGRKGIKKMDNGQWIMDNFVNRRQIFTFHFSLFTSFSYLCSLELYKPLQYDEKELCNHTSCGFPAGRVLRRGEETVARISPISDDGGGEQGYDALT